MKFRAVSGMSLLAVCIVVASCGKQGAIPRPPSAEMDARVFKLAQVNGCIECHMVDTGSIGPSWTAVAERYKEAPRAETRALLIESVMKGSRGKWLTWKGDDGMPPMERRVAKQDVEELVDFILSLNASGADRRAEPGS
jgi:cytochrome c